MSQLAIQEEIFTPHIIDEDLICELYKREKNVRPDQSIEQHRVNVKSQYQHATGEELQLFRVAGAVRKELSNVNA